MSKGKSTQFVCVECGHTSARWMGQCPQCKNYDSFKEQAILEAAGGKGAKARSGRVNWAGSASSGVQNLGKVHQGPRAPRLQVGINEFDRVLGGGIIEGSVVLLGGDPGIGKSTLLLQTMGILARNQVSTLYVTGEESLSQVADRAQRLGLNPSLMDALAETRVESILEHLQALQPKVVVIDSIQTMYSDASASAAGGTSQVRECAQQLTRYAKQNQCAIFLVGHVTKDGELAGPRVLEHLVDAVLYFEGDPQSPYRLVRAFKNRFGAVNELGAFEMTEEGLLSVDNPSALFLAADRRSSIGSCVHVLQEGPRPLLIEIQALMDQTTANNPKRLAVGLESNRLAMLLAVLHRHGQIKVAEYDVFANAVGGLKAGEPASDLPLLLALISSVRSTALPEGLACFGEVGLTGEVRPVQRGEDRIREAVKQGFTRIIVPERNLPKQRPAGIELVGVRSSSEVIAQVRAWEGPAAKSK